MRALNTALELLETLENAENNQKSQRVVNGRPYMLDRAHLTFYFMSQGNQQTFYSRSAGME